MRRHGFTIGAVLRAGNAQIFSSRALDRVHVAADGALDASVREIRQAQYAAALIPTEKPDGYRLPYRAGIPVRLGFENGWGKPLKTLWIRRMCTRTFFRTAGLDPRAPHECEVVFALVRALCREPEPSRDPHLLRRYVIDEEPQADARVVFQVTQKWERLGASFQDVVRLGECVRLSHGVRFVASEAEARYAQRFGDALSARVETFANLRPWKDAIAAARAAVAPDSGAAHVAGMVGTPVLSCFAAENFRLQSRRWAPWAAPHRVIAIEGAWPLVAADALEELVSGNPPFAYTG